MRSCCAVVVLVLACHSAFAEADDGFRILSWNVSEHAFVKHGAAFRSLVRLSEADILLLDEVSPDATREDLQAALSGPEEDDTAHWYIDYGVSGGRQRCVVASRYPLETLPGFSSALAYPLPARNFVEARMSPAAFANPAWQMQGGIPVNGAIATIAGRRLLLVVTDLQCCGDNPNSWQEFRRQVEADKIARHVRQVVDRASIDSLVIAGDFNLVNGNTPLALLQGPYAAQAKPLVAAEPHHLGPRETETWTWDGRGTPFPSGVLDFQLYDAEKLELRESFILDTEDLPADDLRRFDLEPGTSRRISEHRPVVVEFAWQ